jgi:2-iminobutanoate/2-iminopropanoate deaminase
LLKEDVMSEVRQLAPHNVAPAAASYALGVSVQQPTTTLYLSGIVGAAPDGTVHDGLDEQADEIWRTIRVLIEDGGLTLADLVSYTTYVVDGENFAAVMAARDRALQGHKCASTFIVVPRLARPEWRMEIAAIAAR